jgi:hypothetical protein
MKCGFDFSQPASSRIAEQGLEAIGKRTQLVSIHRPSTLFLCRRTILDRSLAQRQALAFVAKLSDHIAQIGVSWHVWEILAMITDRQEREWAKIGARQRLQEIEKERRAILVRYPDLLKHSSARRGPGGSEKGRQLSDAAKKRMSAGMRKWWAKRKAAKATT